MNILIVAPFVTFPDEPGANRFVALAKMLSDKHQVTLVTSRFCHILKSQRNKINNLENINVVLLEEYGYQKNVGVQRVLSHHKFCENFKQFLLNQSTKFDVVYSAYPLIKTNNILGKYKYQLDYKLIIDVQDIWPESIFGPIPWLSNSIGKLALTPLIQYANHAYAQADGLVAVSDTYMKRADVNQLAEDKKAVVFIGADRLFFNHQKLKHDKLVAVYIGTMAGSYDLETVVKAAAQCQSTVKVVFIGTGPDEQKLKELNTKLGKPVEFMGTFPYEQAMQYVSQCDVAINPIRPSSVATITNKLSDYYCCGLPIVSCQENEEVQCLLAKGGGFNYRAGDADDLADKLQQLAQNQANLKAMSTINQQIAEKYFLREQSYLKIIQLIEHIFETK